jgi:hypothetical protein
MPESARVKVVVTVPVEHAETLRQKIGNAGGGEIGNYSHSSFSVRGIGRFRPGEHAKPTIGEVGKDEDVKEERIEVTVPRDKLLAVVTAIRLVHPYEEPVIDVYPLLDT